MRPIVKIDRLPSGEEFRETSERAIAPTSCLSRSGERRPTGVILILLFVFSSNRHSEQLLGLAAAQWGGAEPGVKLISCIFLLSSMGFLCASLVAGLAYSQWTIAAVTGLWSLCT